MNLRTIRLSTWIILAFGTVFTVALELHESGGEELLFLAPLQILAVLPYLILFIVTSLVHSRGAHLTLLIASLAVVLFGVVSYIDAFLVHPDPQSGLVLLFFPYYQLCAVAVILGALVGVHLISTHKIAVGKA